MVDKINSVGSVNGPNSSEPPKKKEAVEQEEQMFDFPGMSALEFGYNLIKEEPVLIGVSPAAALIKKSGVLSGVKEKVKENIHQSAENLREYKKEHPVLNFLGFGLLGEGIMLLDKVINN